MKLSEAIRIGRALRPQIVGDFVGWKRDSKGVPCQGTCDVGAAFEGFVGRLPGTLITEQGKRDFAFLKQTFPFLIKQEKIPSEVPESCKREVLSVVMYLNDIGGWSTERTIGFLEDIDL